MNDKKSQPNNQTTKCKNQIKEKQIHMSRDQIVVLRREGEEGEIGINCIVMDGNWVLVVSML